MATSADFAQHFLECSQCKTQPAQHLCKTCSDNLCEGCKQIHLRKRKTKNHSVVMISEDRYMTLRNSKKKLMPEAMLTACVTTDIKKQYSIRCLSRQKIAIRSDNCHIPIMDDSGKLMTTITTDVENGPSDVLILDENNLIYISYYSKQIFLVKKLETKKVTTDWYPVRLCASRTGDILVCACFQKFHDAENQKGKIERVTSTGEMVRKIRYDYNRPISIAENINSDIIVSDYHKDVTEYVVKGVSSSGHLRFTYDGGVGIGLKSEFWPGELDTDTLGNVIIANRYNNNIHIINKDGGFVRFLLNKNQEIDNLWGLCFDGVDSIWIAELESKKCKRFKYLTITGE